MRRSLVAATGRSLCLSLVVATVLAANSGCTSIRGYYVHQETPMLSSGDLKPSQGGGVLVNLSFEFQTNGQMNPAVTNKWRSSVASVLTNLEQFSSVGSGDPNAQAQIDIVMNNVFDSLAGAVTQGIFSGLTFGLIGTKVTDDYVVTAVYREQGGEASQQEYEWGLISTSGIIHGGAEGEKYKSSDDAFGRMVEQVVLRIVSDLQGSGKL